MVWKPFVPDCWQRAGISLNHRVVDIGAGPGFATIDLAEMVGEGGEVFAIERSKNYTDAIHSFCSKSDYKSIRIHELDLLKDDLLAFEADFSWCRWVACFVSDPQLLIQKIAGTLHEGGVAIFFEYCDYATWRFAPQNRVLESFICEVMKSWRDTGGEPDIALNLPTYLVNSGFNLRSVRTYIFYVHPNEFILKWPASFIKISADRLYELGKVTKWRTVEVMNELKVAESDLNTYMITPMVLEILAEKL